MTETPSGAGASYTAGASTSTTTEFAPDPQDATGAEPGMADSATGHPGTDYPGTDYPGPGDGGPGYGGYPGGSDLGGFGPVPPPTAPALFRRSRTDRMLGGVCGGAAKAMRIDSALLRILLVVATLLGFGAGILIYLVCWFVVPQES